MWTTYRLKDEDRSYAGRTSNTRVLKVSTSSSDNLTKRSFLAGSSSIRGE